MHPLVSVIIPNYNHAPFLYKRIESVLNQTYPNFEVILLDDCSTDTSLGILSQYKEHPKVSKLLINQVNSGSPFRQWDQGIIHSKGTYIWIAESDDFAEKEFLEKMIELLQRDSRIGIAYCQSWGINDKDTVNKSWLEWTDDIDKARWQSEFINEGKNEIANYFSIKNTIPNASAVVFKRELYSVNGVHITMRLCGDKIVWTQLLLKTYLAYTPQHLNYFRTHTISVRTNIQSLINLYENFIWYNFLNQHLSVPSKNHKIVKKKLNSWWIKVLKSKLISKKIGLKILLLALKIDILLFLKMVKAIYKYKFNLNK